MKKHEERSTDGESTNNTHTTAAVSAQRQRSRRAGGAERRERPHTEWVGGGGGVGVDLLVATMPQMMIRGGTDCQGIVECCRIYRY